MSEVRLDVALVQRGLAPSRERAQAAITAGLVLLNGKPAAKPSLKVTEGDELTVTGDPIGYVGRGGLKLEAALDRFDVSPAGLICMDVGASTGGFTDCLLQRGAALVYTVDVGREQLHADLRRDPRVVVMEGTDIRTLPSLPQPPALVSIDVSFISLTLVLPAVVRLMAPGGKIVALIKPQFEVGRAAVGNRGVVREPKHHRAAVDRVLTGAIALGLRTTDVIESPVLGTEGNKEFLTTFRYPGM
ncbi:MAG: putative rRNA methylase [Firmicutes bacterium]|nr:putative rRNA methylase [Bacillota bacterium]